LYARIEPLHVSPESLYAIPDPWCPNPDPLHAFPEALYARIELDSLFLSLYRADSEPLNARTMT